jgi:uncharacterized protein YlxW (UPF0749 family)
LGLIWRSAPITLHANVTPRVTMLASVSLATFLVTALAATQFRSQPLPPSNRVARDEALRKSVNQLEDQNKALKARVQQLQAAVKAAEDETARRSSAAQVVKGQLDEQRTIAGLTALHGPGLTVLLHDGPDPNDPNDRSLGWMVHYQDLQDIVNLLWGNGAEAIAVNGQRIVPISAFKYAGVNILVNNANRLSAPYTVTAIGDPSSLANGIGDPDQLAELKSRNRIYGLGLSWVRNTRLSVPGYDATFLVKDAQPIP